MIPETAPTPADVRFAFDGATDWPPEAPLRVLAGWCFGVRVPIRAVEMRVDGRAHMAEYRLPRADVGTEHPEFPAAAESGFRIALPLPPGQHDVILLAVRDGAPAVELFRRKIEVGFASLQGYVETPGPARVVAGRMHVSGWCFHPQARVVRVAVTLRGETHECRYPFPRPDVARAFANLPLAEQSGFEVHVDVTPGKHALAVTGELDSGEVLPLATDATIDVLSNTRVARAMRALRGRASAVAGVMAMARAWIARHGHFPRPRDWPRLATKAWRLVLAAAASRQGLPGGFALPPVADRYDVWLDWNRWSDRRAAWLTARLAQASALPTISILMPVYRPDRKWLDRAIATVDAQVHARWELCIADDASGDPALTRHLDALAARDPRIKVVHREENGNISRATNSAAALATGDFLLFLDQDDELAPDALGEIALALASAPDADILYTDDDKIDVDGRRYAPQFKPDWSPELLLSYMYFSHAFVVRRSLFATLEGFRAGFEGSQDHDFALRATERARRLVHVPLVLYHWRATPGSTAT